MIRGALQPGLVSGDAPFPASDLIGVLEREADIVETFEEAHAVGGGKIEGYIGTAGAGDA